MIFDYDLNGKIDQRIIDTIHASITAKNIFKQNLCNDGCAVFDVPFTHRKNQGYLNQQGSAWNTKYEIVDSKPVKSIESTSIIEKKIIIRGKLYLQKKILPNSKQ